MNFLSKLNYFKVREEGSKANFFRSKVSSPPIAVINGEETLSDDIMDKPVPDNNGKEGPVSKKIVQEKKTIKLGLKRLKLDDLLKKLVEFDGSDLHLEAGMPPVFRIKGDICFAKIRPFSNKQVSSLISILMNEEQKKEFKKVGNLDLAYEIPELARFRVNLLRQHYGAGAVFRVSTYKNSYY